MTRRWVLDLVVADVSMTRVTANSVKAEGNLAESVASCPIHGQDDVGHLQTRGLADVLVGKSEFIVSKAPAAQKASSLIELHSVAVAIVGRLDEVCDPAELSPTHLAENLERLLSTWVSLLRYSVRKLFSTPIIRSAATAQHCWYGLALVREMFQE